MSAPWLAVPPWWERFWFSPGSARNLAAARIIVATQALWVLLSRDLAAIAGLPDGFWASVSRGARWRYLLLPGHAAVEQMIQAVCVAALVAALLGVLPRWSCLISALLLYHLAPLESIIFNPSPVMHGFEVAILSLVVLAAGRSADAWSVRRAPPPPTDAGEYQWPLRLVQLFVAQIYLFAGYAKLTRVGIDWISAENMRSWLLLFNQDDRIAVFQTLGLWIADRPAMSLLVAVAAVVMDLGFIVCFFWRRSRTIIIPLAVLFHVGILLGMNIVFLNLPLLLVFVDWDRVTHRWSGGRFAGPGAAVARG